MPPRVLGFVRSKIVAFFYLALISPCLLTLTNHTFAQETPVQPAVAPSTPLIHIVRKTDDLSALSKLKQQRPAAHLSYFGGPVVSNLQVVVVFWGPNVNSTVTSQIGGFFRAITNSSYFDLVSEYSTSLTPTGGGTGTNQSIGRGDYAGAYTITPSLCAVAPCTIADSEIKAELLTQVTDGNLPPPALDANGNVNTLYMTYFPHGVTITQGGSASCAAGGFCAYHGTTSNTFNSKHLLYGVVPDFGAGSGCDSGCGAGNEFQNITSVSSHEMIETVTDADVGIATSFAPPLAWYDPLSQDQDGGGEIGDICNAQQAQVSAGGSTYTIQKVWSNLEGACVSIGASPSLDLTAPATAASGTSFNFTVTADNPVGTSTDTSFTGTVHFTSSDSQAVLPADYAFTPTNSGTQTFGATLKTSGSQTITATDMVNGAVTGKSTVTVSAVQPPAITSANGATFTTGAMGTFTVTTTGSPIPSVTRTGTLPTGVSFVDNGNGTGTLSGTPAAGTSGTYNLVFKAHNSASPDATQNFTLTVNVAPAITSANNAMFTIGAAGTFTVIATGSPVPSLSRTGALPGGVSFVDNGNGTGTLSGTPNAGTKGTYNIVFTAHNVVSPDATQSFTLTVSSGTQAPAITSANNTVFNTGTLGSFTVTSTGSPVLVIARTGTLPTGVSFVDNKNGTGTLSGSPAAGTDGTYSLVFKAHNGVSPAATQNFTLTVNVPPAITSVNNTVFTASIPGTFTVTATGSPTPSLTTTGSLPSGVSFVDNGDGTGTLGGTAGPSTNGTYNIVFTAHIAGSPDATQPFTLTVNPGPQPPAITSANSTSFTAGTPGTFTVTATGSPTPSLTRSGVLPGGVTFKDNRNGTATLGGTPTAAGTYNITIRAHNIASPDAIQKFTLTVSVAPVITSASNTVFTASTAGTFTVTSTGSPTPSLVSTGSLPSGVSFVDNGDGTGTLGGTPVAGAVGNYSIVFTAHNTGSPDATQNFALTVNPGPQAPVITSANSTVFTAGTPGTFTVTATGLPTPSLTKTGALPGGVTFKDNGNGTATLKGTPTVGGIFSITLNAHNTASPNATQKFTLTVNTTPPQVSLSPSIVDFGDVNLNTTVQRVVTVKNTGGSTLSISNIWLTQSVDGAFTLTTNCGASLLPSKTCTATIDFSESVQKSLLAALHVADNAASSPQQVAITAHAR